MRYALAFAILMTFSSEGGAQSCPSLASNMSDAKAQLQRAADEPDLEAAQDYARRAKNELEDAENAALDCGCSSAASELDDAARHARRAQDADEADEFEDELNGSIRDFNSALGYIRSCARSP